MCQDLQGHPGPPRAHPDSRKKHIHRVPAAADQNIYLPLDHFLIQLNVTLIGPKLGSKSWTGTGDVGRRLPPGSSDGSAVHWERARRATELPGDVGHVVEVRMEAFFSQDLSLVFDSNCFDPQVFIQGCLSYKTANAIGTIIIIGFPACILCHGSLQQPSRVNPGSAPVTNEKLRPRKGQLPLSGGTRIPTGIGIQNQSEATIPGTFQL